MSVEKGAEPSGKRDNTVSTTTDNADGNTKLYQQTAAARRFFSGSLPEDKGNSQDQREYWGSLASYEDLVHMEKTEYAWGTMRMPGNRNIISTILRCLLK